jgi:hypothetical protein
MNIREGESRGGIGEGLNQELLVQGVRATAVITVKNFSVMESQAKSFSVVFRAMKPEGKFGKSKEEFTEILVDSFTVRA